MTTNQPPYDMIWDDLKDGHIVPFLGAGASLSGRPKSVRWDATDPRVLPRSDELAAFLAKKASFPEDEPTDDLSKVASYFQIVGGRDRLIRRLAEIFNREYKPGLVHEFLAEIPNLPLIVTTNYDDLIEQAFKAKHRKYHLVTYPVDQDDVAGSILWWEPDADQPKKYPPNKLPLELNRTTTTIYKMHGSVDRLRNEKHSFLITEEDYIDFLSRMTRQTAIPAQFKLHFRNASFLFLGYGLSDWNLRVMLRSVRNLPLGSAAADQSSAGTDRPPDLTSWAIQRKPSMLEQKLWQAPYRHRIDICDIDLNEFVEHLRRVMQQN